MPYAVAHDSEERNWRHDTNIAIRQERSSSREAIDSSEIRHVRFRLCSTICRHGVCDISAENSLQDIGVNREGLPKDSVNPLPNRRCQLHDSSLSMTVPVCQAWPSKHRKSWYNIAECDSWNDSLDRVHLAHPVICCRIVLHGRLHVMQKVIYWRYKANTVQLICQAHDCWTTSVSMDSSFSMPRTTLTVDEKLSRNYLYEHSRQSRSLVKE